jgi:hypothetical protein
MNRLPGLDIARSEKEPRCIERGPLATAPEDARWPANLIVDALLVGICGVGNYGIDLVIPPHVALGADCGWTTRSIAVM